MRKLTALCLYTILLIGLAGCAAQPAEKSVPESSKVQTEAPAETQTEEENSAEVQSTEASSEERSSAEAEDSAEETADVLTTEAQTPESSAAVETTAAGIPSVESTADSDESSSTPETERTVFNTFRFTVPDGWALQEDGSYLADEGRILISFYLIPTGEAFSEDATVSSEQFAGQLVTFLNDGAENGGTYELYHSALLHTKSRLANCFILLKYSDSEGKDRLFIFSAYDCTTDNFFLIRISFDLDASVRGEECWEQINRTIERIE